MSDQPLVRKDARPLVWDHPVTAEDEIEMYYGPVPDGAVCVYRSKEPRYEAWMDDI